MEGILSQEEINRLLDGTFNDEQEIENQKLHKEMEEAEYKKANVSKNVTTNESAKSKFGVNSSGKEITALNPKGVHKPSVAADGTIREVNTDVKFTNRIMNNVIAGEKVEYPKTFARGIMEQNPGMFETVESENKGKVLLRPTDEFFSTTNIDRTGEYAKQQTKIQEEIKSPIKNAEVVAKEKNKIYPKGSSDAEIEAALDRANNRKTKTEARSGELLKNAGLFDEDAEKRVKEVQNKVEADSKFEEGKRKRQEEIKAEEIKKKEVINAKIAENKKLNAIDEKEMDSAVDDITKMYSSGTEKINVENINAGKSINNGNTGTGTTGTGSAGAGGTEKVEGPRQFSSPMEKIIAETEYGPAGKTMETSGVFTEDAGKYNLKNIAELEANVSVISNKIEKIQNDKTEMKDVVESKWSKLWGGNKQVELVDEPFKVDSPILKGGTLEGNFGKFGEDADVEKITELGTMKASLNSAKNKLLKESYEPASHGSDVHFERGIISKLDDVQLTKGLKTENASDYLKQLDIDDDTKVSWSKTEDGGLEGIYKKAREVDGINVGESKTAYDSHKIRVNFGKDGAISGFENQKLDAKTGEWVKNEAKIDLGNGQQVGIERAKEIAKMNEKQVRMDMINQNRQAVKDGVEGAKSMGLMEELKLKLGKGAKAEEAKTMLENAKAAVKSHTEATETMAKNIGGILGDAGRVDLKAISAAASGAVEGAAKEAGKNIHAGGNNTGKGMKSLLVLAGVGMAFGAVKATFDNSAEQRRQKQLELMSMRQQYGGAM